MLARRMNSSTRDRKHVNPERLSLLIIIRWNRTNPKSDSLSLFAPLIGGSAKGDWRLHIEDTTKNDVGVPQKWGLAIHYAV